MSEQITVRRTTTVPLVRPDDDDWKELREVAGLASDFGNEMLFSQWGERKSCWQRSEDAPSLFRMMNDELSSYVRGAMATKVRGYWRRSGKAVMARRERLAIYSERGALSIRATGLDDGVKFLRDGDDYVLLCLLRPGGAKNGMRLVVASNSRRAKRDAFFQGELERIWSGERKVGLVSLKLDPRKRKVKALVSWSEELTIPDAGERNATLGPLEDGQLWLRWDGGGKLDFSRHVGRMRHMKKHYKGIRDRIRKSVGRGSGRRQAYRKALLNRKNFSGWAHTHLHQLSREIIDACQENGVGSLAIMDISDGDLPWYELVNRLTYKGEELGIEVRDAGEGDAWERAKAREQRKKAQKLKRAKEGSKAVTELLGSERVKAAIGGD